MIAIAALLAGGVVACSSQGRVARAWLRDSNAPRFNMPASEVRSFWPVVPERMDEAIEALMGRGSVPVSPDDAARRLALTPTVEPGKSLFLIRGIDVVTKPIPMRVFESKGVIDVQAGTFYTCFLIQPGVRAQPLVVALSEPPARVMVGYTCDGL
jgi:hypothetical protein